MAGFGISPPSIKEDRLVKGSHLEKTIYLVQGNPKKDVNMEIVVDSTNIKDWISFEQGVKFVIPAGVQQFPLSVIINVPEDAQFGIYKAFIRINTKPEKATEAGQVAIALGGRVDVDLTVGNKIIYEYSVTGIEIFDIKEGKNLKASVVVKNTGNVPASPSNSSFELFNKYGNIRLAYAENNNFKKTPAFQEKPEILEFPIDIRLAPGEYWGYVKVYNEDGGIIKEMKTVFNVYERTFLDKYTIPILFILVALFLSFIFKKKILKIILRK